MATKQHLVETWNDSEERAKAQELFTRLQAIEDDTVVSVRLSVVTVDQNGAEKRERVNWQRQYYIVEE